MKQKIILSKYILNRKTDNVSYFICKYYSRSNNHHLESCRVFEKSWHTHPNAKHGEYQRNVKERKHQMLCARCLANGMEQVNNEIDAFFMVET